VFRNDFPDLGYLKQMIADLEAKKQGWPNVIINTQSRYAWRPDIKGTLSIFSNIKGNSYCEADDHKVRVEDDMFFITNNRQHYTLGIEENTPAETFNIHFSGDMLDSYLYSCNKLETLLDSPYNVSVGGYNFFNKLYPKDKHFAQITSVLYKKGNAGELTDLMTEELLAELLGYLLDIQSDIQNTVQDINTAKSATKQEIYSRLTIATDYIHSFYNKEITLEELAQKACMSKFHFLRLFKEVYKSTPHQYITTIRLKKAEKLLQKREHSIIEIAWLTGYDDPSTFSRAFHRTYNKWPQQYRAMEIVL
jgi:AraC family transcriptional regulator